MFRGGFSAVFDSYHQLPLVLWMGPLKHRLEEHFSRLLSVSLICWVGCQLLLGICIAARLLVVSLVWHWAGDSEVSHRN
ncbi:hypothetical protein BDV29DRAFT_166660 [Aspergillus leporis]|jgi:hypothetical protein|uniref:Uncharacterized protein n=1 Tax=Aspergillus leporis TaxID=41062 RepID=A0A5N5XBQ3_9EURO|nr:hypothetical protein BDV29DRAFT_166660 [Aspergillus leporis]